MPRKPKKDIAYLTEQEVDAYFRVTRDPRDKALFRVIYHHGLRASEPGKLKLSDYRPGPGRPRLRVVRLKGSVSGAEHTARCRAQRIESLANCESVLERAREFGFDQHRPGLAE